MTKTVNAISIIDAYLLERTVTRADVLDSVGVLVNTSYRDQLARIGLPCGADVEESLLRQRLAKFRAQVRNMPSFCDDDMIVQKMLCMGELYSVVHDYIRSKIDDKDFDRRASALISGHKKLELGLVLNDFIWKVEFLTAPLGDKNATDRLTMVACCLETQRRLRQHWNTVFSDDL